MQLEAEAQRRDGITLVEATLVHDGPDPRRVRIESRLDGPVYPPRREGVPAAGWDRESGTLSLVVDPGDRVGVGFASPAPPVDPPVAVVDSERATTEGGIGDSPAAVVRALGDPTPPAEAVPAPPAGDHGASDAGEVSSDADEGPSDGREDASDAAVDPSDPDAPDGTGDPPDVTGERSGPGPGSDPVEEQRPASDDRPVDAGVGGYPAVRAWLSAVEGRIDRAQERESVRADAERLRAVARRAVELAERARSPERADHAGAPGGVTRPENAGDPGRGKRPENAEGGR